MMAFAAMLVPYAQEAGIEVPSEKEVKKEEWDRNKYKRWTVFCAVQLGSPMPSPSSPMENARIIASLPEEKVTTVTFNELLKMGLDIGYPIP